MQWGQEYVSPSQARPGRGWTSPQGIFTLPFLQGGRSKMLTLISFFRSAASLEVRRRALHKEAERYRRKCLEIGKINLSRALLNWKINSCLTITRSFPT